MIDTTGYPSDSFVTAECNSLEEFKNSKTIPSRPRKAKKLRDRSANVPKRPDFFLGGDKCSAEIPQYNGLKDEHLIGHFYNKKLRKLLTKNGLISKGGRVVEVKTCLNNTEIMKHTFNIEAQDVGFKSIKGGTMILGVRLPKIESQPSANSNTETKRRRVSSAIHSDYNSVETSSRGMGSIIPIDHNHRLSLTQSRLNDSSTQDNSFSNTNTSFTLTNFRSTSRREKSEQSVSKSVEKKIKKTPKALPVKVLQNLQPMTKEDLKAAIERHKHKLNETVIVDESPELNQIASGNSSQRVIDTQTPESEQTTRLDSRNRSRVYRERIESQDVDRESPGRKENVKDKGFIVKRGSSFSPSHEQGRNIKIRTSKMQESNPYQERMSPLEKYSEFRPSRGVETPVKKVREKTNSPGSKSKDLSEREGKERNSIVKMIEEGGQSPVQKSKTLQAKKGGLESTRSSRREASSRQSVVRPSTSSRAQKEKSSRREADPMNRDLVRQDSLENEKGGTQESSRSAKKEKASKQKSVRPSTSSKAQEERSFMRKSTGLQEKGVGGQEEEEKDDKRKRGVSAGGNITREMKLKALGEAYNVPVAQNGKILKEGSPNVKKEVGQGSQSPVQKGQQSARGQEMPETQLERKESSKVQVHAVAGGNKVQKEKERRELRTSANGLNQSFGKIKVDISTPEKKLSQQGSGKISGSLKPKVENSNKQDENQEVKEESFEQMTSVMFGSVLNIMPLDKAFKDRLKEAFRQRNLTPDSASRSQSPTKDNKRTEKL